MNHYSRLTVTLLATVLVTGCASQATLRIHSEPLGAYITDNSGRLLGTAPVDVSYMLDENSTTCIETDGFSAHWVSGVEEDIRPLVLCEAGYTSTLIYRDYSQPGLAEDREFALQIQMLELQQAETRAAQDAAAAAWASAAAARDAAYAARWYARPGYRNNSEFERNYRDNNRERYERSDYRNNRGNLDLERSDGNYRDPNASGASRPDRSRDRDGQADNGAPLVPSVEGVGARQSSVEEAASMAVLQQEQVLAEQAAAEQQAAEAATEQARLIVQQQEQVRVEHASLEAEAEQARLSAQQEEQTAFEAAQTEAAERAHAEQEAREEQARIEQVAREEAKK